MKLFYYNKKDLTYKSVKVLHFVLASVIVSILTYMYGYLEGREDQIIHLTPQEKEIIFLNVSDTTGEFSTDKMVYLMKELNIKYPHIVFAQSLIETGHFDSKIFKENNNLFGMKQARTRVTTAQGTQYNHAYYDNWRESVYDYAFYQCRYLSGLKNEEEYLAYLGRSYAEDPNYVSKIRGLVKRENLKDLFE
jgi:hypothetical protein